MSEDLFENAAADRMRKEAPLARRVAPRTLDEIVGQDHVLGPGKILRRAIEADRITSLIIFGPPGCGKTAIARLIAMRTKAIFENVNAVTSGVKDLREVIARAKERRIHERKRTILFVDEIHRFNKAQQDALLPDVENGNVILIGATTENPFFSVVAPLLSRSQLFEFKRLEDQHLIHVMRRALSHPERGLDEFTVDAEDDALAHIANFAEGDTRRALNALDVAMLTTPPDGDHIHITLAVAEDCIQRKMLHYDGTGDDHYDTVSAFIKSMRGSNPDSAVYWMARMLEAGDDPRFVARRICICASEDVGNADPQALILATAAWQACEFIGMPEARILLSQAATYVACAPKSNAAYKAINAALHDVRQNTTIQVPSHLQDGGPQGHKIGRGVGYEYAHDGDDAYITQNYGVPRGMYYHPSPRGHEAVQQDRLRDLDARDGVESDKPTAEE